MPTPLGPFAPFLGALNQDINPWTWLIRTLNQPFGLINVTSYQSSDPATEQRIVGEVAGYGRQFVGMFEISNVITASRKVHQIGATVADLIGQSRTADNSEIAAALAAADALVYPFDDARLEVVVTAIEAIDASLNAEVAWSAANANATARTAGTPIVLPDQIVDANMLGVGEHVIMVEVEYRYLSPFGFTMFPDDTYAEVAYAIPRQSVTVTRITP